MAVTDSSRRGFHRAAALVVASLLAIPAARAVPQAEAETGRNLAVVAKVDASYKEGYSKLPPLNDQFLPRNSRDESNGGYSNWPTHDTQWVEYAWPKEVSVNGADIYWWDDHRGTRLPVAARLKYWDGQAFVAVPNIAVGIAKDTFNAARFAEIRTTRLRLEMDAQPTFSTGILEWKVFDSGNSPAFPPIVDAGPDRFVVLPSTTALTGHGTGVSRAGDPSSGQWSKATGPGDVTFADATRSDTTASFSAPGEYTLKYAYTLRGATADNTVNVHVENKPAINALHAVYASRYQVSSPFWKPRLKNQIINWIPHCIDKLSDVNLPEGGIGNIIEAGKKLRGEPFKPQTSRPWSNAYVFNIVESMAVALTLDPQGDAEIIKAQDAFRQKLDEWIPLILAAQEPDGYFQTRFTLGTPKENETHVTPKRWNAATRGEHEGYIAGYFIEAGIAHYIATDGKDRRLYDAARKLADCWVAHIGPAPKQAWYDGHEEIEQALVRLGRFVNDTEGAGHGQQYIDLAKFLLDCRGHASHPTKREGGDFYAIAADGTEYDQSNRPVTQQYTAAGHAVRAAYAYSAMADITAETGDPAYWSATKSIWDNIVNRKLYVTGGIGSGETSEGFGHDYSLPNASAYVESCSSCGLLFMQYKMNLATHDSKYADIYETTIYNAILGDVDLAAKNFTYTNSLDSHEARYLWHGCPCCVGNIPRVLLMLPTWTYAKSNDAVYVNLFAGSTVNVGAVAGTDVQMVQNTDYPWKGGVSITVNPTSPAKFTVYVRSPKRDVSELYTVTPVANGITSMKVNGETIDATNVKDGYVAVERTWKAGDTIEMELPLVPQTITATDKVAATRGKVALARGPLVYNVESVDQELMKPVGEAPKMAATWSPELLGGVVVLKGQAADGTPLTAVPNYARLNRGGRSMVWMPR